MPETGTGNWNSFSAVQEIKQVSTTFSPFELPSGHKPHGVLNFIRETWEEGPSPSKNEIQHVLVLSGNLYMVSHLNQENLLQEYAQVQQSRL